MHESEKIKWSCLVISDSYRPHGLQPTRLPHPWDSPGKNTGVGCHFFLQCMKVKSESEVTQSCPDFCSPMDCSPQGSSAHGIFQARMLEQVAISYSRGSSQPRDWTYIFSVSCIASRFFTIWATREAQHIILALPSRTGVGKSLPIDQISLGPVFVWFST